MVRCSEVEVPWQPVVLMLGADGQLGGSRANRLEVHVSFNCVTNREVVLPTILAMPRKKLNLAIKNRLGGRSVLVIELSLRCVKTHLRCTRLAEPPE